MSNPSKNQSENSIYLRQLSTQEAYIYEISSSALMPPEDIEVDIWAEQSIELTSRVTRFPGRVNFDTTPYSRAPLQAFKRSRRTVCVWGAQVGKTLLFQCAFGYVIDQDPGAAMIVYPDQKTAQKRSKEHIQPIITESPPLAKHLTGNQDDFQILIYHLDRMTANLVWSGSPSALAAEPVRYLFRDEFAKFQGATDKEADAMSLSARRTTSYDWMARILDCTTPTTTYATGWTDLITGTYNRYWAPCPHCNEFQVLVFSQFDFPSKGQDEDYADYLVRIKKETFYKCEHCDGKITDLHKMSMIKKGEWRPESPNAPYESFHLPSWYAPWKRFYEVVEAFIEAKYGFGNKTLQDWINSDCAEPWEERGENADQNKILAHKGLDYDPCFIPTDEPVILIATFDVQKDYLWYLVRAHSLSASYLIEFGTISVKEDITEIRDRKYPNTDNKEHSSLVAMLDTGWATKECYEFVLENQRIIALKGEDHEQSAPIKWQKINKYPGVQKDLPGTLKLMHIDTIFYKEELLLIFDRGFDENGNYNPELSDWHLHNKTGKGYAKQLMSETVVEVKDKRGNIKREWRKIGKNNHLLDLEVYQLAGRDLIKDQLRQLSIPKPKERDNSNKPPEGWR